MSAITAPQKIIELLLCNKPSILLQLQIYYLVTKIQFKKCCLHMSLISPGINCLVFISNIHLRSMGNYLHLVMEVLRILRISPHILLYHWCPRSFWRPQEVSYLPFTCTSILLGAVLPSSLTVLQQALQRSYWQSWNHPEHFCPDQHLHCAVRHYWCCLRRSRFWQMLLLPCWVSWCLCCCYSCCPLCAPP